MKEEKNMDVESLGHSIREIKEKIKHNDNLIKKLREKNILAGLGTIILNLAAGLFVPSVAGFCLMTSSLAYIVYSTTMVSKTKKYEKDTNRLNRLQMSYELEIEEKNRLVENQEDTLVKEQNAQEEKCIKNISNVVASYDFYDINDDILEEEPMKLNLKK